MLNQKKSSLKVAINGFGRIGRLLFRQGFRSLNIVVINGTSSTRQMAHLLQYDSIHGAWKKQISVKDQEFAVEDQTVFCLQGKHPDSVAWDKYNVDIVIECTGRFKKWSDWQKTFSRGVKKVIISAPAADSDFTLVYGVNQHLYQENKHHLISNASCTSNSLVPLIKILKSCCGVERGFFSTIHSYTNDQKLLDSSHKTDLRRARAAGLNIIPTGTGAGSALSLIFPELKDRIQGIAVRVPTANVSLLDLMVETKKKTSLNEIHAAIRQASLQDLAGILAIEEQPLVSSDFIGRTESSIVDFPLTRLQDGKLLKLVSWYDNETGFSQRIIDFIHYMDHSVS